VEMKRDGECGLDQFVVHERHTEVQTVGHGVPVLETDEQWNICPKTTQQCSNEALSLVDACEPKVDRYRSRSGIHAWRHDHQWRRATPCENLSQGLPRRRQVQKIASAGHESKTILHASGTDEGTQKRQRQKAITAEDLVCSVSDENSFAPCLGHSLAKNELVQHARVLDRFIMDIDQMGERPRVIQTV